MRGMINFIMGGMFMGAAMGFQEWWSGLMVGGFINIITGVILEVMEWENG